MPFAETGRMPERPTPSTYNEPTILWRMRHPSKGGAHGVIVPGQPYTTVLWCVCGLIQDTVEFREWKQAIIWLNAVSRRLQGEGWNVVAEGADVRR